MEPSVQVAIWGVVGVVLSGAIGLIASRWTRDSEKEQTAEATLERAWEQRLLLKDDEIALVGKRIENKNEKIAGLEENIRTLESEIAQLQESNQAQYVLIVELQQQLEVKQTELAQARLDLARRQER